MHLGALTTKRFVIAAAATALTFFAPRRCSPAQASATSGGVGSGGVGLHDLDQSSTERVGTKYARIWDRTSSPTSAGRSRPAKCESGGDPDAIGSGGLYRGAFQFMRSTWKASPKSPGGDPIAYPYRLRPSSRCCSSTATAPSHWPVCG